MNKSSKFFIGIATLFLLYQIFFFTGIFVSYTIPTTSNEPGILQNSRIFSSNLMTPQNTDLICFKNESNNTTFVFRLVAQGNDIVEIKNGILFVNNVNIDKNIETYKQYNIDDSSFFFLKRKNLINQTNSWKISKDVNSVFISKTMAEKYNLASKYILQTKDEVDLGIKQIYKKDWNKDHFGPLRIPKGKYFVLGDNRHNAKDSRYIGFIDKVNIVGTVLFK